MRLRNVKDKETIMNNSKYLKDNYIPFNNSNPIHIEIGMGKGNFIINMAKRHPNINFIGIEKYDSVIVRALQKLEVEQLDNLYLIRMDACNIYKYFNKCIDTIYLNFSDPWPKDRHYKRRLTYYDFLKLYDKIFKSVCHIVMKTDNRKLFEFSIKSLTDYNYTIKKISLDLYKDEFEDNIQTEYEEKFHALGYPIYMLDVEKDNQKNKK